MGSRLGSTSVQAAACSRAAAGDAHSGTLSCAARNSGPHWQTADSGASPAAWTVQHQAPCEWQGANSAKQTWIGATHDEAHACIARPADCVGNSRQKAATICEQVLGIRWLRHLTDGRSHRASRQRTCHDGLHSLCLRPAALTLGACDMRVLVSIMLKVVERLIPLHLMAACRVIPALVAQTEHDGAA
eukprot:7383811-Prymnesium_polylepis.2